MTRRFPLWAALLIGWCVQVSVASGSRHDAWRPELLVIIAVCTALRSSLRASLIWSCVAGWFVIAMTSGHSWWLLTYWMALMVGLRWLRTQWDTERWALAVVMAWFAVMAWHGLTWLLAWSGEGAPRAWSGMFVFMQTCVTVVCTILWWRYAHRWIALEPAQGVP